MTNATRMRLFTKSAFKQALHCPASLYYYYDREHYANQMSEDDFLQALADGGNQVGDLAKVYYGVQPDADIDTLDGEKALEWTAGLLKRNEVNIAEAAFRWKDCFVRADIICKKGNHIDLVEVKAKSWNPETDGFFGKTAATGNAIRADIREYVYDVAFQKYVIQKSLGPGYTVTAHLMLADKTAVSDAPQGVNQFFRVVRRGKGSKIVREDGAEALAGYRHVLLAVPVDEVCQRIYEGKTDEQAAMMGGMRFEEFVEEMSHRYVTHERHFSEVDDRCFSCPFYSNEKTSGMLDGRKECWEKKLGIKDFKKQTVGELWCGQLGNIPLKKQLLEKGTFFLSDVTPDDIPPSARERSGLTPEERRVLQVAFVSEDKAMMAPFLGNIHDGVYLDIPSLKAEMEARWHYPLHMIDFETTAVALPFYPGMAPYEQVAFQFSHHIIGEDGSIKHAGQYLNDEKHHFPNFDFVRELKRQLETDKGTIFRYSNHENTILRAIHAQLESSDVSDRDELRAFIDSITHYRSGGTVVAGERDMVDLWDAVKRFYYHPSMKGSNSIKAVLPAILNSSEAIRKKYSERIYGSVIPSCNFTPETSKAWITILPDGTVESPYHQLDTIASFLGVSQGELEQFDNAAQMDESIANGGAALAAYTRLQFSDAVCTQALREALLRYCELDTMSMVFIWEYFHEMTSRS